MASSVNKYYEGNVLRMYRCERGKIEMYIKMNRMRYTKSRNR